MLPGPSSQPRTRAQRVLFWILFTVFIGFVAFVLMKNLIARRAQSLLANSFAFVPILATIRLAIGTRRERTLARFDANLASKTLSRQGV